MKSLYRSKTQRIIGGIGGGLGDRFHLDPFFFRIILILIAIFTAFVPMLLIYLVAMLIIPQEPGRHLRVSYKKLYRSKINRRVAGVLGGISEFFQIDASLVRLIFIICLVITGIFPLLITYIASIFLLPQK